MYEVMKTAVGQQVGASTMLVRRVLPGRYQILAVFAILAAVLWLDMITANNFPMGLFYLLTVYVALRYVSSRFGYFIAVVAAVGKAVAATVTDDITVWLFAWKFFSSVSFYLIFCYLMDEQMTRGRRAESALGELSVLNDSIVNESDSGILVFKESGECVLANHAAANMIGFAPDQLWQIHLSGSKLWQGTQLLKIAGEVGRTGISKKSGFPVSTYRGKDIWCHASVSRIDRQGEAMLLVMLTDITAYKEVEQALRLAHQRAEEVLVRAVMAEKKVISVSEETQARIGQELHDDLGQHLTGVAFMSEVLLQKLNDRDSEEAADALKIKTLINGAIDKTRRVSRELYPVELDEPTNLHAMLAQLVDNVSSIFHIECTLAYEGAVVVGEHQIAVNLFRIAQEAINNAIKHGAATRVALRVTAESSSYILEISDNGCGIKTDADREEKPGIGMRTMQYRASTMGGDLLVSAGQEGGVSVKVRVPILLEQVQDAAI